MLRCSIRIVVLTMLLVPVIASAQAPGPYYARGSFYCSSSLAGTTPPDSCYGYGPALELFDDGGHDDGTAGDGVYGGWVVCNQGFGMFAFKIANADWSFNGPSVISAPLVNGRLFTTQAQETVHFRLDLSEPAAGWEPPIAFANDHAYPAGAMLELIGSGAELGNWTQGLEAELVGSIWQRKVMIATPGYYEYKFRVLGSWNYANFGYHYNNNMGANGTFFVTDPDTEMMIQFDELSGRIRAIANSELPVQYSNWGGLKALYR